MPSVSSEPERERHPPPRPTPLDFPVYNVSGQENQSELSLHEIYDLLACIRRPQDISASRFRALNLNLEEDVPVSSIAASNAGEDGIPPLPWDKHAPEQPETPPVLMSNDNPYPSRERFEVVKQELLHDNDDAFRELARLPPRDGREKIRVTQTRRFWNALENMSQYWDVSLDHYYERLETPGKPKDTSDMRDGNYLRWSQELDRAVQTNFGHEMDTQNSNDQADRCMVSVYTGRRIGTGSEMPDHIREEAIRSFTDMAAWPFGCQAVIPTLPPRVSVGTLLFPIRQSFEAVRSPRDGQSARNGGKEGPLFVGQCRHETAFRSPGQAPGSGIGDVCDLYREVGAMLLAAQERAREGSVEIIPGEGKWWTSRPRWGGAPNESSSEDADAGDSTPWEMGYSRKRSKLGHMLPSSRRMNNARTLSNSERWKVVQPGPSLWDKRMQYMQIGKPRDSPFDDVRLSHEDV